VRAHDLLALADAREVGLAFSLGHLSVIEVRELIADAEPPSSRSPWQPTTGVRMTGLSRHSFRVTSSGNRSSRT
jgi:hypothetical protein